MSTPPTGFRNPDDLTLVVSTTRRGSAGGGMSAQGVGVSVANTGPAFWRDNTGARQSANLARGSAGSQSYTTTNSRSIAGWTSVRVSRGIERCPGDFEVEFTEPMPGRNSLVASPGDECQVYLGTDLVLSGFVDRYMPSYTATQHTVRITGRGKCQDLVDCSAKWSGGTMKDFPILAIAQQLCAVYDIPVRLAEGSSPGDIIPAISIMVGEPIYGVLERLCRHEQLLLYEQADGSLLLSKVGTELAACGFTEGVNVLAASAVYAMDGRFSDYDAVLMSIDSLKDQGDGGNLLSRESDPGVQRFRYRAIVSESPHGTIDIAQRRLHWEMVRRIGRSFQVRVTTDSWRDSAGKLWTPNTLVPLDLPGLNLSPQTWTIADVTYRRDLRKGTTAELLLMPPQAFNPEPLLLYPQAPDQNQSFFPGGGLGGTP
ncbi:phage baseplate assembly protein [Paraburkholderia sp. BR14320]|uniref:phage baseplate assembly protein n=1 Tax=unclassified Paraburkholderia TaxID=2615204 RepID=UPI0034D019F6